ncbi:MAG: hypothetical protein N3E42_00405 [Candidatus Bipolaricaulota bacterium]|nr:hypothetical protein [Candidatus Bipolaricaulota bacterium]
MRVHTVDALYNNNIVRQLPPKERLRLAALILHEIVTAPCVEESDVWGEEDLQDLVRASLQYAAQTKT